MSEKTVNDNPTTSDSVVFELDTTSGSTTNPYEVKRLTIYFVSRDYASSNLSKYNETQKDLEGRSLNEFYFREAEPVHIVGSEQYPAWLSTDTENALLENVGNNLFKYVWEPKGVREGDYFICWTWKPLPAGDSVSSHIKFYLKGDTVQSTSMPMHRTNPKKYVTLLERYLPSTFKDRLSSSDVSPEVLDKMNKSIASGFETLEDLANQIVDLHDANCVSEFMLPYLSNFFGCKLKTDDATRWRGQIKRAVPLYKKKGTKGGLSEALEHVGVVLKNFSQLWQVTSSKTWQEVFRSDGVNSSFTLEKLALDPLELSNFELYFRYRESTEWIALDESYIELNVDESALITWVGQDNRAEPLSGLGPKTLRDGDEIRIVYQYAEMTGLDAQNVEDYVRSLPLMDLRDNKFSINGKVTEGSNIISGLPINSEFQIGQTLYCYNFDNEVKVTEILSSSKIKVSLNAITSTNNADIVYYGFEYPPKNWNTRVIRGDDPLFSVIVPNRNPFFDQLIFGKIRTEFPYSENIYHMEEYNGSIRDSKNPCDIDKSFVDPCYSCASSSYDVDVEIEELSTDKVEEVKSTIRENLPFHAVMHTCNFIGGFNEFISTPQEEIEILVMYFMSDFVVAGNAQSYFSRIMLNFETQGLRRSDLANEELVFSGSGICSNSDILVYCPGVVLSEVGVNTSGDCFIEIKSPSSISGSHPVEPSQKDAVKLISPSSIEPIANLDSPFEEGVLNSNAFTFDLNTLVRPLEGSLCNIEQDNIYKFRSPGFNFTEMGIRTIKDVQDGRASDAWSLVLSYGTFPIKDIVNGYLILEHDASLPSSPAEQWIGGKNWTMLNGSTVVPGSEGELYIEQVGKVTSLNPSSYPVIDFLNGKNCFQKISGTEYHVAGIVSGTDNKYYIQGYDQGNINGTTINIFQKLVDSKIGYLGYRGMNLTSGATESSLGIQNGSSYGGGDLIDNNSFRENFIVVINETAYWIYEIDNNLIKLSGRPQYFRTSGTIVNFEVYKYNKVKDIMVQGQRKYLPDYTFPEIDRDGRSVIVSEIFDTTNSNDSISGLSDSGEVKDIVGQQEEVSFSIEYKEVNKNE